MPRMYSKEFLKQLRWMGKLNGITKEELKKAYDQVFDEMSNLEVRCCAAHVSNPCRSMGAESNNGALNLMFDGIPVGRHIPEMDGGLLIEEDVWP